MAGGVVAGMDELQQRKMRRISRGICLIVGVCFFCLLGRAVRSEILACLAPTTSSSSASIISLSTPSPTPTLSASNPSFAAPASSPQHLLHPWRQKPSPGVHPAPALRASWRFLSSQRTDCTRHRPNETGRGGRTATYELLYATGQPLRPDEQDEEAFRDRGPCCAARSVQARSR